MVFVYFPSKLSELLVTGLISSLIFFSIFSYLFSVSFLSSIGTSANYLFSLISSMYQFILLIMRYKGFTLLVLYVAKVFYCHISNAINKNIFVWLFIYLNFIWIKILYINHVIVKSNMYNFLYFFFIFLY